MRRGELSLKLLITIIVLLALLLVIFFPTIKRTAAGLLGLSGCNPPAECRTSCDEGYKAEMVGDAYCAEKFQGTKTNAVKCCAPLSGSGGSGGIVRKGDIRVYYQGDLSSPLTDGSTVTWTRTGQGANMQFTPSLKLAFQNMEDAKCYYSLKLDSIQPYYYTTITEAASGVSSYLTNRIGSKTPPSRMLLCETGDFSPKLTKEQFKKAIGKNLRLTIYAVPKGCTDIYNCGVTSKTIYITAKQLNSRMSLLLDGSPLAPGSVTEVKDTAQLQALFTQPLGGCAITYDNAKEYADRSDLNAISKTLRQLTKLPDTNCFYDSLSTDPVSIPFTREGIAPGTVFSLTLEMDADTLGKTKKRQTYKFRIPRDEDLMVTGMTPGLTKEKRILIECPNAICTDFHFYKVEMTPDCMESSSKEEIDLKVQTQTGGRSVVTLHNETLNGKYLCVQATVSKDGATRTAYATALYRLDLDPVKINIDHTPPRITVGYDPWKGILKFTCDDQLGKENDLKYVSGCPPKAFSYAYVTDPFLFATSVATGGTLNPAWSGCPDADQGKWLTWNSEKGEMPYIAHDVRVICMRGTDNAGNHAVESKLLYNGQEALAAILTEVAK